MGSMRKSDARADFEAATHDAVHTHFENRHPENVLAPRHYRAIEYGNWSWNREVRLPKEFPHWRFAPCQEDLET